MIRNEQREEREEEGDIVVEKEITKVEKSVFNT